MHRLMCITGIFRNRVNRMSPFDLFRYPYCYFTSLPFLLYLYSSPLFSPFPTSNHLYPAVPLSTAPLPLDSSTGPFLLFWFRQLFRHMYLYLKIWS